MLSPIEIAKRQLTLTTHRIHTLPVLVLMAHSRCNCRCVMCDIWRANHNGTEISRDELAKHVDTFRKLNVQWVILTGGEALMHSNLWALCELLRSTPVKITLLSTGLLLKRYAGDILRWCDEVIVSLDGSREIHNEIRNVSRAYDMLSEGVATLKGLAPNYPVSGRCVIQRRNYFDLPNIIDAAHALGLNRISFLAADVSTTAFNRPVIWGDERIDDVALSPEEVVAFNDLVERTIQTHAADFASGFVAEDPGKLRRLPRYFAALNGSGEFPKTICNAPWVSTVIESDGTVRPCYFQPALGNIHEQQLDDILNADHALAFRQGLDVTRDAICRKCVCTLHLGARAQNGP